MRVDVIPIEWAVLCDICGFESTHSWEEEAEEAAQEHIDEGCWYR